MNKYIATNPEILGGAPVVKGTRIPIERIKFLIKDGFTLHAIQQQYPQLTVSTLQGVLDELFNLKNSSNVSLS